MSSNLDRALLLLGQSRHDLAEKELRRVLAEAPDNPMAHACLALCLLQRKQRTEAAREAVEAVRLGPDLALSHYILAKVYFEQDRDREAEASARQALELDPFDADYHGLLGAILLHREAWDEALAAAETGLAIDPKDVGCTNLRALALVKLGRKDEAREAIDGSLAQDPENPFSHANQGWTLLHQGDHRKALDHFREALRLDPDLDYARAGLLEALKARNPIYRVFLNYFLWMANQSTKVRWGIVLAIAFGPQLLQKIGQGIPALAPYLSLIAGLLIVFVYLTWVALPLFNLLLWFDPIGRHALRPDERAASRWVGLCLLGVVLGVGAWFAGLAIPGVVLLIVSALLVIPIAAAYATPRGWPRRIAGLLAIALAMLGLLGPWILLAVAVVNRMPPEQFHEKLIALILAVVFGCMGSTWLQALLRQVPGYARLADGES